MNPTNTKAVVWMKSKLNILTCAVACWSLVLLVPNARALFTEWPFYEPFGEYPDTTYLLGGDVSSNYWNFGNGGLTGVNSYRVTNTAAMSYIALMPETNDTPKGVEAFGVTTTSADRGAWFPTNYGTIYASFLLNYIDNGSAGTDRLIFNLVYNAPKTIPGGSFTQYRTTVWLTPDYRLRIAKNYTATWSLSEPTPVITTNAVHLIVLRYERLDGDSNDVVSLWIDPKPFGDNNSVPPPLLTTTNGPDCPFFNGVMLMSRKLPVYTVNKFLVDEIRIANSWAEVTPLATPPPGPMFAVTGGGVGCAGDTFPIGLSGSVETNVYMLFTNDVYAEVTLAGTGSPLNFGLFSTPAYYSVLASNPVTGYIGWMSNSPAIRLRPPLTIVGQPTPVITATNNRAQFTVVATSEDLTYQWLKDGSPLSDDWHITGSSTATLVIWPAGPADVGSYRCKVTNPCGFAMSDPATLSLDGVDELIWKGNSFLNLWDVGNPNYPYFLDTNLNEVVFNPGDSVTFDDSATTPELVILTNILTPTRLTVNAIRNYVFGGNGTIAGEGRLVKDGAGRLAISNTVAAGVYVPNTFTGGTAITNGAVAIYDWRSIGTGPITLAGGTLETFVKGNQNVGLSNDVFVVANSIWQIDQSGQQSASLMGALLGSPGTTLSLTNSSTATNSPNYIFFNGTFTNHSAIVLSCLMSNWGLSGQRLILNPGTGKVQILNGPISENVPGVAGLMKQGQGAAYLNAANTYTVGTTNSAGLLAGTGSIASPLVVESGAAIGGGSPDAIGTFTVNNDIILSGNVFIRVDKSLAQPNDKIAATGTITNTGTGTVTVTNIGVTALAPGDTFQVFTKPVINGDALTVTGEGVTWQNNLAVDGSIRVVSVIPNYPTNMTFAFRNGVLDLSWPATHLGWILQCQTNTLSVGLNPTGPWYDIPGSETVTAMSIPVDPATPTVFYRLRHP